MTGGLRGTVGLMAIAALCCVVGATVLVQNRPRRPISAAIAAPISRSVLPSLRQPPCARATRRFRCSSTARSTMP